MEVETAVVETGDNAPVEAVEVDEGAAPESLSDAELTEALKAPAKPETAEIPAEEVVEEEEQVPEGFVSKAEHDKLLKKVQNQELFLQRQGTEVGNLRKLREQLETLAKSKRALAEEQLLTNPSQAMDTHAEARDAEAKAKQTENQERFEANRNAINTAFPDYEQRIDDVAAAMVEMGYPPKNVENYKRNPYAAPVSILLPYVRAAALRKHYFEKSSLVDKLTGQLKELTTNQGSFPKKLKEAALKAPVIRSAGGAGTEGSSGLDEAQIPELSYAELENLLKPKK